MVTHIIGGFINANPSLEGLRSEIPAPPAVLPLVPQKSVLYPLPMQKCNEAKIDSNIEYIRRLLKHIGVPDKDLDGVMIPMYGDVFSVDRLRLAEIQCRDYLTDSPLDKFQFAEPFFGPFHLLVSLTAMQERGGLNKYAFSLRSYIHSTPQMPAIPNIMTPSVLATGGSGWSDRL